MYTNYFYLLSLCYNSLHFARMRFVYFEFLKKTGTLKLEIQLRNIHVEIQTTRKMNAHKMEGLVDEKEHLIKISKSNKSEMERVMSRIQHYEIETKEKEQQLQETLTKNIFLNNQGMRTLFRN